MKTGKKIFFILPLALFLLFCLAGCSLTSLRYEPVNTMRTPEKYPFKIYLKSIKTGNYDETGKANMQETGSEKTEAEKLRKNLIKNYPQYFTGTPENAPQCDIKLIRGNDKNTGALVAAAGAILAYYTLGLIPIVSDNEFDYDVIYSFNGSEYKYTINTTRRISMAVGLSMLFAAHCLVPRVSGYHDSRLGSAAFYSDSQRLQELIVDALNNVDRNKVQELYFSKYVEKTEFLE